MALEANRSKHLVLIDTPGYGRREMDSAGELARFLASRPEIDVHLVVTASMKSADLSRVVEQFSIFRPGNLLFTRLDETESVGTLYSLAARTAMPISFLGTGQRIPEDLQPAEAAAIAEGLAGRAGRASRAA
jgi:flagellar biosynthesis protein FlhF